MKRTKYFILIVILAVLGFFFLKNQDKIQSQNQTKQQSEVKAETASHLIGVWIGGNLVQIGEEEIFINPCGGECIRPSMHLNQGAYPDLFKIYDKFTRIEAQGIHDISGKDFVFLTNNIPDHGGYATTYGVIVDPEVQSIVYTTPKELRSPLAYYQILPSAGDILFNMNPYLFNNSCISCYLGMLETVAYDTKQKKYISVNQRSIPGFKALLEQYNKAADDCFYKGQKRTVQEVISMGGRETRCADEMIPSDHRVNDRSITVGEFLDIKDNIQKIINGQELSLVHY